MTPVVLDPKITAAFGRSYHRNLCGFLRFIRAKLIFETKFTESEFFKSLSDSETEYDLSSEYAWLKEDEKSKLFIHHEIDPEIPNYQQLHDCLAFLKKTRPVLIATDRETIEKSIALRKSRLPHVQQWYVIKDATEDFTYQAPKKPPTRYYGGVDFETLTSVNTIARHWKALHAIPDPKSSNGKAHIKSLVNNFCESNDVLYIFDRTVCSPIAQAPENGMSGTQTHIYQILKEVLDHPNLERVVVVTEALSFSQYGDERQETYDLLGDLFDRSNTKVEFYAVNKKHEVANDIFTAGESRPYELAVLIGSYLKYEWHHFSVLEGLTSPPKVYAYFLDDSDMKSLRVYKKFRQQENTDFFCDWTYRSDG